MTVKGTTSTTTGTSRWVTFLLLGLMGTQILLLPVFYMAADDVPAPSFLRLYGIAANLTSMLNSQAPQGILAIPLSIALRGSIRLNSRNQLEAASQGALKSASDLIGLQQSPWKQAEGINLLRELMRDNPAIKEIVLKQGLLDVLLEELRRDVSDRVTARAAWAIANFAADASSNRKKRASATGLVDALVALLKANEGSWRSDTSVNVVWALSNLLADAPAVQTLILQSPLLEALIPLLTKGVKERIVQPALCAAGNLAAKHTAGQDALSEAGSLKLLVSIIEEEVAGVASLASQPFHAEVLEHISELQRSDPAVKDALSEVGGLEELLSIVETGTNVEHAQHAKSKQLVAIEDQELNEDGLASMRLLMRELQDEADTESSILPDLKLPVLSRAPSGARILPKLLQKSRQQIAGDAAWALSLLVADHTANQNAAREAGALDVLVKLLESAEDAGVAKSALSAISSLVKNNPENKAAAREANGVQGLVKLLASNPADKDVLKATAEALKYMSLDRPVYETVAKGGFRWLRVLGRIVANLLSDLLGMTVTPIVGSGIVVGISSGIIALLLTLFL